MKAVDGDDQHVLIVAGGAEECAGFEGSKMEREFFPSRVEAPAMKRIMFLLLK